MRGARRCAPRPAVEGEPRVNGRELCVDGRPDGRHRRCCAAGQLRDGAAGAADADVPRRVRGKAVARGAWSHPRDDAAQCDYYRALTRYVLNRACLSR
ncbi:phosphatase [Streptomyces sp. NRRL S-1868]|uniref:phosphatase n=1 Tax=Streptomyces sp. NRRL S-1868 TaxID=1463892 RepID=UPI000D146689|nr:phosphatase [Streptomyces sp. NRRL S-1868]